MKSRAMRTRSGEVVRLEYKPRGMYPSERRLLQEMILLAFLIGLAVGLLIPWNPWA